MPPGASGGVGIATPAPPSVSGASGGVSWQDQVRAQYSGPATQNQRMVIEVCMARTAPPTVTIDPRSLVGQWLTTQADGIQKTIWINEQGQFHVDELAPAYACGYDGTFRLEGTDLIRTLFRSTCGGTTGTGERFPIVAVSPTQFTIRSPAGEVTYVRLR